MTLPIRIRLTAVFTTALAVVLVAGGFLLYDHLSRSLDGTLDRGLRARAADVAALVTEADTGLRESPPNPFAAPANGFAQVLDARGRIFDQTPTLGRAPLLTPTQLARARKRPLLIARSRHAGEPVRLLALPIHAQGQRLTVIVGASLNPRDEALQGLRRELLVGGPIALLLVSLIGYAVAAAALRPVERLRAGAETLSASRLDERLPVSSTRDELSRLGTTLNDMLGRLETSVERERRFVADASHELRTPLALLRAEIDLALDLPRSDSELEASLRSAGEEVDRLTQLAEDLLLLARIDRGVLPLRTEVVDVDALIEGVAARFERRARDHGRRIAIDGGGALLRCDRLRLEQALGNLVENALRHGNGDAHIFTAERGDTLELHVTDGGPGFPPRFLPRVFDRFSRAEAGRGVGGSGLGLAIVSEIAAAHGGTAHAANLQSAGADVWLSIPRSPTPTRADRVEGDRRPTLTA